MKASELRIGNWFDHHGEYKQVTPNTILEVWEAERIWVKPILLTEDILLKCEFICNIRFEQKNYYLPRLSIYFNNDKFQHDGYDREIKYLHQLQNLYFALTGEELNIEL